VNANMLRPSIGTGEREAAVGAADIGE